MERKAFDFILYAEKVAEQVFTGEITQEEADARMYCFMEGAQDQVAAAVDGLVPAIRKLESNAAHYRAMAAEYIKKAVACESTVKRTKESMGKAMETLEVRELEGVNHKVRMQKGQKKVMVNEEKFKANKIDSAQYTSWIAKIDKRAIKDTLAGGGKVAGCELVQEDYVKVS
jgi:hypothetical protein